MGRKIYDEDLRLNLILNGQGLNHGSKQMVAELGKMEMKMINLEQTAKKLAAEIKVLARDEIANAVALKDARKAYSDTTQEIRAQAVAIEKLRQQVGLAGMTVQQLKNHAKALQVQLNNMTGNPALRQRLLNDLTATNSRIRTMTTGAGRLAQAWERIEHTASRAGSIMGMFAMVAYSIVRVVTNVITRMKELEDLMGTVRKNTELTTGQVWEMKQAFDAWDTRTKTDDLLKLAIVAGKLGIQGKDSIMAFVESANMIQIALGDDLDGTVEDTVNSIGKLTNAFRTFDQIDKDTGKKFTIDKAMLKTGSILNELAKSSAASAGTILNYMTRLSAVSELAGFTQAQVGGIASAMDAMNVPSERGATAIQKIMMQLANPKKINEFAGALGLANDEFGSMDEKYKTLLKDDPNKVMLSLLHKFVATKDGLVELTGGMKDFGAKGQYMTAVIGSMAQNLDVIASQQDIATAAYEKGTSILNEYNIMNNNFTADILKQQIVITAQTDQLNKDAEPAVLKLVTAWAWFVVGIKETIDFIGRHWQAIKLLTATYIALHFVSLIRISNMIAETVWLYKSIALDALKVFWLKASILWTRNLSVEQLRLMASSKFLTIANIALTQGFAAARAQMILLTASGSVMAFPFIAIAGAAAAVAGAFYWLVIRTKELTEVEKRHNELQKDIQQDYFAEKAGLTVLMDRLKDVNIKQGERLSIIKKINTEYGQYLPKLLTESTSAKELAASYDLAVEAMARKITYEKNIAAGSTNIIAQENVEAEIKLEKKKLAAYKLTNAAQMAMQNAQANMPAAFAIQQMETKIAGLERKSGELIDEYTKLQSAWTATAPEPKQVEVKGVMVDFPSEETFKASQDALKQNFAKSQSAIKANALATNQKQEDEQKALREDKINYLNLQLADMQKFYRTEGEYAEAYLAVGDDIIAEKRAMQLNDKKTEKKVAKTAEEQNDAWNKAQITKINQRRLDEKTSQDQYDAEMLQQEFDYLQAKLSIYDKGSEKYEEAEAAILLKKVTAQQKVKDLILQAQKELSDANIDNLEDGISKEKAIEEKRWADELALLKKRLNEKKKLNDDEVALNAAINAIIVQKKEAHENKITELDNAGRAQKEMAAAEISGNDKQKWAAERTLAHAQYAQEIKDSKGQSNKVQKAEKKLSDQLLKIKMEELDKRQAIGDQVFEGADKIFGGLAELAGKETALGKAAFLFQQASAIGQIIFNTAIANAKAAAMFPLTGGMPWVGINTAAAAVSIALVVKQALTSTKQKAKGSYPVIGSDDGVLYHASDGGNPRTGVYNRPTLLNMSDGRSLVGEKAPELVVDGDTFRRLQLNAPDILRDIYAYAGKGPIRTRQRAEGSYPDAGAMGRMGDGASGRGGDGANGNYDKLITVIDRLNSHIDKGIRANINKYGRNGLSDSMDDIAKFNTKVYKK